MKQFSEHIWYRDEDSRTDLPYCYYMNGDRFSLAVDAGNSPESHKKFLMELEEAGLRKPDLLVLTHWHYDHSFGLPGVECPVIASKKTQENLIRISRWKWTEEAMLERLNSGESLRFAYEKLHIIYPDITKIKTGLADILFDSEMELNLGGVTAHLIHVDTPHTRDAVLIYVPEDKVLIGGDAHDVDYYDNRGKFDADRLKQFVDFLQPLPFEHYLKGHDGASVEKGELLSALENGKTLPGSLMM
ncbi:MBL fold metallo-hydrolase [Dialister sp.]|uniref:MBL fold metallo-hydrolase n=1 Tax=Dialister sp. TaxID=1955814 RepID=UPI002E7FFC9D|nr:MBL fold metallo-hydrolase [Dialister sp.]